MQDIEIPEHDVELFCEAFIETGSPARAAAKLGYAGSNKEKGEALLRNPQIRKRLLEKYGKIQETYIIECNEVVSYLMSVLRMNPVDYVQWGNGSVTVRPSSELTREETALVSGIKRKVERDGTETVEVCLPDKYQAADKLAKIFGLYNEKLQLVGPNNGPIPIQAIPVDMQQLATEFARQVALAERQKSLALPVGHGRSVEVTSVTNADS